MDKESASNQAGIKEENKSEEGSVEQTRSIAKENVRSVVFRSHQSFARLTKEEQDLAVAHTFQQQERAFRSLALGDIESDDDDENIIDGSRYPDDESYARALQESYVRALDDSDSDDSIDSWLDGDPDNMSYEEMVALSEAAGVVSRGLSPDTIASLPSSIFVADQNATSCSSHEQQCVICCHTYQVGDSAVRLPCKHQYHRNCIQTWFHNNGACPVCRVPVTACPESEIPPAAST